MVAPILPLILTEATVKRRGKTLVGPITYTIEPTGFTIIVGPNGSGKTSLLRMMHGLERLNSGTAIWAEPDAEAQRRQAYVFQTPIMMRRSVRDNLTFPLTTHGTSKTSARMQADEWLRRINLSDARDRQAPLLSGGEKQKLALARALIRQPDVLFLDEPCANLDGRATREIEEILHHAEDNGVRIIMATHDMGQARRLATEVLFIHKGRIHETANAERFFEHTQTPEAKAFLKGDIVE
ncbi:MAG: ABC transporter ATP-binding protein [Paracoccaceae bacterium]